MTVTLWQGPKHLALAEAQARLAAEGYVAVKWSSEPYQVYLPHAHIYSELLWVLEGELTVALTAERRLLELGRGDRMEVPAGIVHALQAGPEGAVYLAATR